jgi:bifunctional DNA-binding transcriptional regulator/antitoxin component of YhaV-PrlF toxin-antitoxin module
MATKDRKLRPVAVRAVSRKGGSIYITIPSEIVQLLNLNLGDSIAFLEDKNTGSVIIKKVAPSYTTPEGFSFSISKKSAKNLLKKENDE